MVAMLSRTWSSTNWAPAHIMYFIRQKKIKRPHAGPSRHARAVKLCIVDACLRLAHDSHRTDQHSTHSAWSVLQSCMMRQMHNTCLPCNRHAWLFTQTNAMQLPRCSPQVSALKTQKVQQTCSSSPNAMKGWTSPRVPAHISTIATFGTAALGLAA